MATTHGLPTRFMVNQVLLTYLCLSWLGILVGVLSGSLGIGGGIVMVPTLSLLGATPIQATATSLVGVCLSAISGSWKNFHSGQLKLSNSLLLSITGAVAAPAGAALGERLPDPILSLSFALFSLTTIYLTKLRSHLQQQSSKSVPRQSKPLPRIVSLFGIGLLAGGLSGLFGVGGGIVMVPLQILLLGEPIKSAVRTSLGAIAPIAISGLVQHAADRNVIWNWGLCLGIGSIGGAQIGTRLLPKLSDRRIGQLFVGFVLLAATYMTLKSFVGD